MQQLLRLADEQRLRIVESPGPTLGGFDPSTRTIRLSPRLSRRTARSVLAHELAHAELGHVPDAPPVLRERQELRADEWAAALLVTPEAYAQAESLRGAHLASLAFELDVTIEIVRGFQRLLRRRAG